MDIKEILDKAFEKYHKKEFLFADPLEFPHKYKGRENQEIVALIASCFAYGNVKNLKNSVRKILEPLGEKPFEAVKNGDFRKWRCDYSTFRHRFNTGDDVASLLFIIKRVLEDFGDLKNFFFHCDGNLRDAKNSLVNFTEKALSFLENHGIGQDASGIGFLFPSPRNGSACKRLNMFLRWMVRKDEIDFGHWSEFGCENLVIPVDTHIARISRHLGLTSRKDASWKTAREITGNLKFFDGKDPVRYDFALSHIGILKDRIILPDLR
ncbi:MAG: TIGR02757 family protein [Deltaproteobacteria bacterium]|nr:TIGR02757 family protein [Deltaproteobacteria bacterium]